MSTNKKLTVIFYALGRGGNVNSITKNKIWWDEFVINSINGQCMRVCTNRPSAGWTLYIHMYSLGCVLKYCPWRESISFITHVSQAENILKMDLYFPLLFLLCIYVFICRWKKNCQWYKFNNPILAMCHFVYIFQHWFYAYRI